MEGLGVSAQTIQRRDGGKPKNSINGGTAAGVSDPERHIIGTPSC
jgi:hypothetical protein